MAKLVWLSLRIKPHALTQSKHRIQPARLQGAQGRYSILYDTRSLWPTSGPNPA